MKSNSRPKLSIVVTSRNDTHGGNMQERMKCFLEGIYHQSIQFGFGPEIIMVEWNPPGDRPPLKEILPKPPQGCAAELRIITVSKELHESYGEVKNLPLHQMIAKNVGIRRAKADFVLATNVDILFNEALFNWFVTTEFDPNIFYRANRHDVPQEVAHMEGAVERLKYCGENAFFFRGRDSSRPYIFFEAPSALLKNRFLSWWGNLFASVGMVLLAKESLAFHQLDLQACGDFTLMHREAWEKIQGYAEFPIYPAHLDSVALIAAHAEGIKQMILPRNMIAYHIDHPTGWDSGEPSGRLIDAAKRPGLDFAMIHRLSLDLFREGGKLEVNPQDWGLQGKALPEEIFTG